MVRNPYAQVEGIMRRNQENAKSAAEFAIRCLQYQERNKLRTNTLFISYEELCDNSHEIFNQITQFLPELNDIDLDMMFTSHNYKTSKRMRMRNLNHEKILNILDEDLDIINSIFIPNKDLLEKLNYKIITR